jgi:hypothetical protein
VPGWLEVVLPVGAVLVPVLLGRRTEGLWRVLEVLAHGRAAAVLERERRRTAEQLLRTLPEGGRWDERDEGGRRRTVDGPRRAVDVAVPPSAVAPGVPSAHGASTSTTPSASSTSAVGAESCGVAAREAL